MIWIDKQEPLDRAVERLQSDRSVLQSERRGVRRQADVRVAGDDEGARPG